MPRGAFFQGARDVKEKLVVSILILLFVGSIVVGGILIFRPAAEPRTAPTGFTAPWRFMGNDAIAIVHVYGEIHGGGDQPESRSGANVGADSLTHRLRTLSEDDRVKAVILRINSPGGSVGASQEIYDEVQRLRKKGIKVVASMADMGASGAYYVASAADRIVANPGALVGSVGVIMMIPDFSGLTRGILKIDINTIKSGEFKDMGSPFRNMTDAERTKFQDIVNDAFEQFKKVVLEGRQRLHPEATFDEAWVSDHLNGLVFTGQQALDANMIEELGGLEEAKATARKLAGLGEDVTYISEERSIFDLISRQLGGQGGLDRLADHVDSLQQARLEYMFRPGL